MPPGAPGGGAFDFSALQQALNDPAIKQMAEQIANDDTFKQITEQLQSQFGLCSRGPVGQGVQLVKERLLLTLLLPRQHSIQPSTWRP